MLTEELNLVLTTAAGIINDSRHANRSATVRILPMPFEAFRKGMSASSRSQTLCKILENQVDRIAF